MDNIATIGFRADVTGLRRAERGLDNLARSGESTERRINRSVDSTNRSFNSLRSSIGGVGIALAALGGSQVVRGLVSQSDAWKNINSQIRQVTESEGHLISVRTQLLALSKDTRSELSVTVDLYSQLTRSTKDLGTSQEDVMTVTKTLNNLFVAGGKPISEVTGAIRQLSQAFASGVLRGDEFNSVAEGAPKIMDALGVSLGKTRGELRAFAATGGITAEIMVDALKDYSETAQGLADMTTKTFGQSIQNASTNVTEFIGEAETLNDAIDTIGSGIEDLSGELGNFSDELERWTGQFSGWGEDASSAIEGTSSTFSRELMALGVITDQTLKLLGGALIEFPANVRAMAQIIGVELGFAFDMMVNFGVKAINAIVDPFVTLPAIAEAHIKAFGNVLGTELAATVAKLGVYGDEIQDVLNPFDGDTFDYSAELAKVDAFTLATTNSYLQAADEQIAAVKLTRDETTGASNEQANARIAAANMARDSTISAILAERDATLASYRQMGDSAKALVKKTGGSPIKSKAIKESVVDLSKLSKEVDNFGGAWSRTGNVIVDAFSDMGKALDDYSSRMSGLDKLQSSINEERKKEGADTVELSRLQMSVDNERVSAELAGMSAVSNGVGSLFDEKTAASKSFAALSKIIAVAEIAMSVKRILMSNTEAASTVGNEATKQAALGLTAVVTQGQGDPYTAPFRMAAMAAIVAGLGIAISGGGGSFTDPTQARQDEQGTGSVLGSDEKSGSILAAQDRFEDIQLDQLGELRGIRGSMTELSNGISLATRSLIASGGEFSGDLSGSSTADSGVGKILSGSAFGLDLGGLGSKLVGSIFGSTKKKVTDTGIQFISSTLGDIIDGGIVGAQQFFDITKTKKKLFGLSKKVTTSTSLESVDAGFEAQIGGIFASIGTVIGESAALLGFDIDDSLNAFQIDLGKISLEGMSGEEIEKELSAVFSQQADLIAGFAIPALSDYQKVGEGAFETLTRVTHEQAAFNDAMDMLGNNFGNLSSIMQIDIAQSLIDLTGGFEKFNSLTSEYFSEFFSETEQFERLTDSLTDVFKALGEEIPKTKELFRELVEDLDLSDAADQETFATLMQLVPGMTEYFEGLESVVEETENYTGALNDAMAALKQSVRLEKDRASELLTAAKEVHSAELERISLQRAATLEQHDLAQQGVDASIEALNKSFEFERNLISEKLNLEKNAIREASSARLEELNSEKQLLDGRKSGLSSIINNMTSLSARLTKAATASSSDDIAAALLAARGGDFSKAQELSGKLPTSESFGTAAEFRAAQGLAQNQLGSIAGLASNRAGGAQSELDILESMSLALTEQMQSEKDRTQSLLDKADETASGQIAKLTEQQNTLLGIDTTILSLAEATAGYQAAQLELDMLFTDEMLQKLDNELDLGNASLELAQIAYDDEILRLDNILINAQSQLDTLLNIDTSVLSVAAAVNALQSIVSNPPPAPIEVTTSDEEAARNIAKLQTERLDSQEKTSKSIAKSLKTQEQLLRRIELNGAPA